MSLLAYSESVDQRRGTQSREILIVRCFSAAVTLLLKVEGLERIRGVAAFLRAMYPVKNRVAHHRKSIDFGWKVCYIVYRESRYTIGGSMKKHSGMRPLDIVVLLKLVALDGQPWKVMEIARQLHISQSEISESLNRNRIAGLLDDSKKHVFTESFLEFMIHGLKYVFPQKPGPIVRGMPTAHSAPPLSASIHSGDEVFVWPYEEGSVRGEAIEPLYNKVPKAAMEDSKLYELLALVDAIRVGRSREHNLAVSEIKKRIARHG
jgi:hypothetical protein